MCRWPRIRPQPKQSYGGWRRPSGSEAATRFSRERPSPVPPQAGHPIPMGAGRALFELRCAGLALGCCWDRAQELAQAFQRDRLGEVVIEARLAGALSIVVLSVTSQGNEQSFFQTRLQAQPSGQLV